MSNLPTYRNMRELLALMDEPYRSTCGALYEANEARFRATRGSTHNHQTWEGGYHSHLLDGMNYGVLFYAAEQSTGRPMRFSLSDVLVAFFLHDLEKPWRFEQMEDGSWQNATAMQTKAGRQSFREAKMAEYGILLSPEIANAVRYAEGEGEDYRADRRMMNELAAFVHLLDNYSARGRHDFPVEGDPVKDPWANQTKKPFMISISREPDPRSNLFGPEFLRIAKLKGFKFPWDKEE